MKRGGIFLLILLISGCAQHTLRTSGECQLAAADSQAVQLTIISAAGKRQLLSLHNSWQADHLAVVAIDPVGAVQFSGELGDGRVQVQASPLYRGMDAAVLLRVYGWWLQRDNRAPCWNGDGFSTRTLDSGEQQLTAAGKLQLLWHPDQPSHVGLPRDGTRLIFKATQ